MTWRILTVLPVWVVAIVGAVVIAVVLPRDQYLTWVAVLLAVVVILTFAIQLGTARAEGYVSRAMASIGVSLLILAAATGIVALLG